MRKQSMTSLILWRQKTAIWRWLPFIMLAPILCISLFSYQGIQARLLDFLELEGSNTVHQVASEAEMHLAQIINQEIKTRVPA